VEPPLTLTEILTNTKLALEQNWLLNDEFYSDQYVERLSGGDLVTWASHATESQYGSVTGFGKIVSPVQVNSMAIEWIVWRFDKSKNRMKTQASIHLNLTKPDLEALFEMALDCLAQQGASFLPLPTYRHSYIMSHEHTRMVITESSTC
jgi:hypothetical protein